MSITCSDIGKNDFLETVPVFMVKHFKSWYNLIRSLSNIIKSLIQIPQQQSQQLESVPLSRQLSRLQLTQIQQNLNQQPQQNFQQLQHSYQQQAIQNQQPQQQKLIPQVPGLQEYQAVL